MHRRSFLKVSAGAASAFTLRGVGRPGSPARGNSWAGVLYSILRTLDDDNLFPLRPKGHSRSIFQPRVPVVDGGYRSATAKPAYRQAIAFLAIG
jgi:hypothetical protein